MVTMGTAWLLWEQHDYYGNSMSSTIDSRVKGIGNTSWVGTVLYSIRRYQLRFQEFPIPF